MAKQLQPLWRRLPAPLLKAYACLVLGGIIIKVPWWMLKYLVPATRPRKGMNIRKCIMLEILRSAFTANGPALGVLFHTPTSKALELGKNVQGLWIDPLPESLITGKLQQWARTANVSPKAVPGYWIHKRRAETVPMGAPPSPDEKVLLFLHGGAYVLLSAHPSDVVTNVAKGILEAVPSVTRALSLEYRLSTLPNKEIAPGESNPFPAALMDALQGYWYLVRVVGFRESQIVVVGDSAGGNLAHALVRYLVEYGSSVSEDDDENVQVQEKLPGAPGYLVLSSPWVDMTGSFASDPSAFQYTNRITDYIHLPEPPNAISAPASFIAPFGPDFTRDVYVSPANKVIPDDAVMFEGFPKTFIAAGGGEVLLDQIRLLKDRMRKSLGEERVVYVEAKDAFHDYLTMRYAQPERRLTLEAIRAFLDD